MSNSSYMNDGSLVITYKIFKMNILNILKISQRLNDNWHLKCVNQITNKQIDCNNINSINSNHDYDDDENDNENENMIYYLNKFQNSCFNGFIYTFEYQIFYSFSYQVPVLYLNISNANGKLLNMNEIYRLLKLESELNKLEHNHVTLNHDDDDDPCTVVSAYETKQEINENNNNEDDYLDMLTLTEHPYLHKPYFYIHPCKTSQWMFKTKLNANNENTNYTLKWLSFIFSQLNLKLDITYAIHMQNNNIDNYDSQSTLLQ